MGFVVGDLLATPALRLLHRQAHALGDLVGIEDHPPIHITCRSACRLGQRAVGAQEALLVSIKHGH